MYSHFCTDGGGIRSEIHSHCFLIRCSKRWCHILFHCPVCWDLSSKLADLWRFPLPCSKKESMCLSYFVQGWCSRPLIQSISFFLLCFEVDDNMWTVVYSSFKPRNQGSVFALQSWIFCIKNFWFSGCLKGIISFFCQLHFVAWVFCECQLQFNLFTSLTMAFAVSSLAVFYPLSAVDVSQVLLAGWCQQEEWMFGLKIH